MFKLHSPYKPTGDQPKAIEYLSNGIEEGKKLTFAHLEARGESLRIK